MDDDQPSCEDAWPEATIRWDFCEGEGLCLFGIAVSGTLFRQCFHGSFFAQILVWRNVPYFTLLRSLTHIDTTSLVRLVEVS